MVIVVDTSIAIKWAVVKVYTTQAVALRDTLLRQGDTLVAPHFLMSEVTNTLHSIVGAGLLTDAAAEEALDDIRAVVTLREVTLVLAKRALAIARQTRRTYAYDTQFLALAEQLGCDLWTADDRFARAVARHGFVQVKALRTYPLPPV